MGTFIDAETLKARSRLDSIRNADTEDIEVRLIIPAEARIEEAFDLDLDTDAEPRRWSHVFEIRPGQRQKFLDAMQSALVLICDRMETNPHEYGSQSVRGSSAAFGPKMPMEVKSLMRKWGNDGGKTGSLFKA